MFALPLSLALVSNVSLMALTYKTIVNLLKEVLNGFECTFQTLLFCKNVLGHCIPGVLCLCWVLYILDDQVNILSKMYQE